MAEFEALGVAAPLNPFLERSRFDPGQLLPGAADAFRKGDTWYGLPWYVGTHLLFSRKDHLREVGLTDVPTTWEGFRDLCRRLRVRRPGGWPILIEFSESGIFQDLFHQQGGRFYGPGEGEGAAPREATLAAFSELSRWRQEGWAPWGGELPASNIAGFIAGQYSMLYQGPWVIWDLLRQAPGLADRWGTARLPGERRGTSLLRPCGTTLFRSSRHPEEAWRFMSWLAGPEAQVAYFRAAGNLPVHRRAWEDPELSRHPSLLAFREQVQESRGIPFDLRWPGLTNAIGETLDQLGHGRLGPEAAADRLEERLRRAPDRAPGGECWGEVGLLAVVAGNLLLLWLVWYLRSGEGLAWSELAVLRLRRAVVFLLPALTVVAVFRIVPVVWSFGTSLTDWDVYGIADPSRVRFVGVENSRQLWHDATFWQALRNTLVFLGLAAPLNVGLALTVALLLHEGVGRLQTVFRVGFFLPVVTTLVAASVVWRWIFHADHGPVRHLLAAVGLPPVNWLEEPWLALVALVVVAVWKNFGYNMVIFLVARQSLDPAVYEAAALDGASNWQQCRFITLPLLRRAAAFALVVTGTGCLQVFTEPYIMTRGGPANGTLSVVLFLFREGFQFFRFGYASAAAFVLFGATVILSVIRTWLRAREERGEVA